MVDKHPRKRSVRQWFCPGLLLPKDDGVAVHIRIRVAVQGEFRSCIAVLNPLALTPNTVFENSAL